MMMISQLEDLLVIKVIFQSICLSKNHFTGQGILITQAEIPQKIIISEEEILKEINRRKNKPKKRKEKKYEILDKFYYKLEFDGKPIRKIEKVENSQKQYEYEEQQKYILSSKGKAAYQFNSKESQSQQINANNQTQQNLINLV